MTDVPVSRGQQMATELNSLLRAKNPLIWIVSREETRVEGFIVKAAAAAGYKALFWDIAQGVTDVAGRPNTAITGAQDPGVAFTAIRTEAEKGERGQRAVWVMRDLNTWLEGTIGAAPRRQLRNLARYLPSAPRKSAQAMIILTTDANVPPDLAGHATVLEWPLPDRIEIEAVLNSAVNALPDKDDKGRPMRAAVLSSLDQVRETAVNAAIGLTAEEAASCYAKSLVTTRRIDPAVVTAEKKRAIAKEGLIEWIDPIKGGLDAVGGLENLKDWLSARRLAFTPEARAYGLQSPRGVLLIGPPGTGKSLCAKAISAAWEVPLLKLDLGALKGKFVGESERNVRKAFSVVAAVGRAILWIDEIEKALAGATQGAADGGVSADALGTILQWMQERPSDSGTFVVATANDASALPPELIRAGRFDCIWLVDVPNPVERAQVLKASLRAVGREAVDLDYDAIVAATDGFTGSEIAALVPSAMFRAFADSAREIHTEDVLMVAKEVVPLAVTAAEKLEKLREWAKGRARPASKAIDMDMVVNLDRTLDL